MNRFSLQCLALLAAPVLQAVELTAAEVEQTLDETLDPVVVTATRPTPSRSASPTRDSVNVRKPAQVRNKPPRTLPEAIPVVVTATRSTESASATPKHR